MAKTKEKVFFKTDSLLTLLKQVHLGGIINECVVDVEKGKATIEAVDITASIVVVSTVSVGAKALHGELGLGNLELLVRFLSTMQDPKLSVKISENRMMISRKDRRRRLDYLLSQPALIPTRLRMDEDEEDENPSETFKSMVEAKAELNEGFIKDFGSYVATLKTKITTIRIKEQDVTFTLGPKSEHQFQLSLPLTEKAKEDFSLTVNGESLAKILSVLEFFEGDDLPTIGFGDDTPIIIEADNTLWAISPSQDVEED